MIKPLIIQSSKDILGGTPVFYGTRVPISTMIDYLEADDRLKDFLKNYPSVSHKQAFQVLELLKEKVLAK